MRKSFNIFRLFAVIIMLGTICLTMTACDPDDVDAFAKGYRDGYNSTHSRMSNTDIPEAQGTDTNAEQ
ncbi:MAG: hypothetical protein J6J75_05240 [Alistipes sp.]|nr:hypothetical protein [Alistipes sp.]